MLEVLAPLDQEAVKLRHSDLSIPSEGVWLDGALSHAPDVRGLAVILMANAHTANNVCETAIAGSLQQSGYATLVVSLVTRQEDARDPDARYNVPQMARRLLGVADWVGHQPALAPLAMGLIASSTTSGAAIRAAWKAPGRFDAIVCRAGRPDLAGATPLRSLTTPIRIVVGSDDAGAAIVTQAFELIGAERDWQVVAGAGELFVEPDTLERFARLAADWFALKLAPPRPELAPADADADPTLTPRE
jgi:dienelactone hydrolase